MEDPIQGHPTRAEQLDILADLVVAHARDGDAILDLGCGTGYVAHLILSRRPGLGFTGIDMKQEALDRAAENLAGLTGGAEFIAADLSRPEAIAGAEGPYRFVVTALTLHDLSDDAKQALIAWAASRLTPDGVFFVYDRLRLTAGALYPLQRTIWERIERMHGHGMRAPADYDAYRADLSDSNRPAALMDYLAWFADLGMPAAPLHLYGNVALIAAACDIGSL
jgi:tRNA (cmo5U34)-methyltransferase